MKLWAADRTYWHEIGHIIGNSLADGDPSGMKIYVYFGHEGTSHMTGTHPNWNGRGAYAGIYLLDGCKYTMKEIGMYLEKTKNVISTEKSINYILNEGTRMRALCGDAPGKLVHNGDDWVWKRLGVREFIRAFSFHARLLTKRKRDFVYFMLEHIKQVIAYQAGLGREEWREEVYE